MKQFFLSHILNDFHLLNGATMLGLILTILFGIIRTKTTQNIVWKDKPINFYSKKGILKNTLIIISLEIYIVLFYLLLFISLINRSETLSFSTFEIVLFSIYTLTLTLYTFAVGIYLASILTEQYVLNSLKKDSNYKILKRCIDYLHGPISHVILWTTALLLSLIICVLEKRYTTNLSSQKYTLYILNGFIWGILISITLIWNIKGKYFVPWKHQIPWSLIILVIYVLTLVQVKPNLRKQPFNATFFIVLLIINLNLICRFIHHKITKEQYKYGSI